MEGHMVSVVVDLDEDLRFKEVLGNHNNPIV